MRFYPLRSSWQFYLLHFFVFLKNGQSLYSTLAMKHLHAINTALVPPSFYINIIEKTTFWEALKKEDPTAVANLQSKWRSLKPLMHLSSKALITLLQEEISPLHSIYQQQLTLLKQAQNRSMQPEWLKHSIIQVKDILEKNQHGLQELTASIHQHLFLRTQIPIALNAPRNVDDMALYFMHEINAFRSKAIPLNIAAASADLDDDRRLVIFDILQKSSTIGKSPSELFDAIISPIPHYYEKAIISPQSVHKKTVAMHNFCKTLMQESLPSFSQWTAQGMKNLFHPLSKRLFKTQKMFFLIFAGYFLATGVSLLCYFYLSTVISAFMTLPLLDHVLFYLVGLAPITFTIMPLAYHFLSYIQLLCTYKIREHVSDAIDLLKETQWFIAAKLSHPIIDLAHFDIHFLEARALLAIKNLQSMRKKIKITHFFSSLFLSADYKNRVRKIDTALASLEKNIKRHLGQLSSHIAHNLGEEGIFPFFIKPAQIKKYQQFILHHGNKHDRALFNKNTDVLHKWEEDIQKIASEHPRSTPKAFKQPWGNFYLLPMSVQKWDSILGKHLVDPTQKKAAQSLNALLQGHKNLDEKTMALYISHLPSPTLHKVMQEALFQTLQESHPHMAQYVSQAHKKKIRDWYHAYKKQIKKAHTDINAIFESYNTHNHSFRESLLQNEKKLQRYYTLFDAENVYLCAYRLSNNIDNNKVRNFFAHYKGRNARPYLLAKLVCEKEQQGVILALAQKRLAWILSHREHVDIKHVFDENDDLLFHNPWLVSKSGFNFSKAIELQATKGFLRTCQEHLYIIEKPQKPAHPRTVKKEERHENKKHYRTM